MDELQQSSLPRPSAIKPFLKWAGGKHRLVARIVGHLPQGKRLIEPFVGSGAVLLGTGFRRYLAADANADLIDLYAQVQGRHDDVAREVEALFVPANNAAEAYYRLRDEFNRIDAGVRKAALFVYLNRHCFNGLCRYNAKGGFNVPFGRHARPAAPLADIAAFRAKSRSADFLHLDFRDIMTQARPGDVVYCDPPYVPLNATSKFTTYATGDFSLQDQQDLATLARGLAGKGIPVIISNHDTGFTRDLYHGARFDFFPVQRYISSDAGNRKPVNELIAVFDGRG